MCARLLVLLVTTPLLYSVNPWIKHHVHTIYFGGVHHVWCSEVFDARSPYTTTPVIGLPPSSNPVEIYRRLATDCREKDKHSSYIRDRRAVLLGLAVTWEHNGRITADEREEIVYWLNLPDFDIWRPLLYVIPRAPVSGRVRLVPAADRAGMAPEYVIEDLRQSEFDILEFPS
jgi:hypothetical protein